MTTQPRRPARKRAAKDIAVESPGAVPVDMGPVEEAVRRRVAESGAAGSPVGELAIRMARDAENIGRVGPDGETIYGHSLTSRTMAARVMLDALAAVDSSAPAVESADGIDELLARRKRKAS